MSGIMGWGTVKKSIVLSECALRCKDSVDGGSN
jgi:hypothetical protein